MADTLKLKEQTRFVISGQSGTYSQHQKWVFGVCETRDLAESTVEELNKRLHDHGYADIAEGVIGDQEIARMRELIGDPNCTAEVGGLFSYWWEEVPLVIPVAEHSKPVPPVMYIPEYPGVFKIIPEGPGTIIRERINDDVIEALQDVCAAYARKDPGLLRYHRNDGFFFALGHANAKWLWWSVMPVIGISPWKSGHVKTQNVHEYTPWSFFRLKDHGVTRSLLVVFFDMTVIHHQDLPDDHKLVKTAIQALNQYASDVENGVPPTHVAGDVFNAPLMRCAAARVQEYLNEITVKEKDAKDN